MILLAALLSFGWPAMKTEWVPASFRPPAHLKVVKLASCCGSMKPYIQGGETAYADTYHGQPILGYIVDNGHVTHQCVAESKDAILCSGSANSRVDPWVPKRDIRWVILYIVRK